MSTYPQVPLEEVCRIVGGGTPRRSNAAYFDGAIPWATPTDVTALDGLFIERTKETITKAGLAKSSARLIPVGTVLMTSRATIGITAIATQPMATNQGFANLICSERVAPEYLAYWLRSQRERLIQLAGGTTFRELPKSTLKKVQIPLPPLNEQRRIVGILNTAAKIERLRAKAQERLREFVPALFVKMFGDPVENPKGWKICCLDDLAQEFRYGTSKKCGEHESDGDLPILRIPNVLGNTINWTNLKYTLLSTIEANALRLDHGDVLFVRTNGNPQYIGRCAVFRDGRPAGYASYLIRMRLRDNGVIPDFVASSLSLPSMRNIILRLARTTAGNYNISIRSLKSIPVPVPPVLLQMRFVSTVETLLSIARAAETANENSRALTDSLLTALLTGNAESRNNP